MRLLCIFLLTFSIFGCATTPSELRSFERAKIFTIGFDETYQAAFRKVLDETRKKYGGYKKQVDGILYSDIKSGEISVTIEGAPNWTFLVIDVKEKPGKKSEISVYFDGDQYEFHELKRWLEQIVSDRK